MDMCHIGLKKPPTLMQSIVGLHVFVKLAYLKRQHLQTRSHMDPVIANVEPSIAVDYLTVGKHDGIHL